MVTPPPITLLPRACFLAGIALAEYALRRQTRRIKKRRASGSRAALAHEIRIHHYFSTQFQSVTKQLDPSSFKRIFRLSRAAYLKLLTSIRPYFAKLSQKRSPNRRETLPCEIRLGVTLRLLAGAEAVDVSLIFGVGIATVYQIFHEMVRNLDRLLKFPNLPRSEQRLHIIARKFKLSRAENSPLDGCVGALDRICIKIAKPDRESNPAFFFCRKGYYAIPVQAVCDSDYVFRYASGLCGGATHDALANAVSGFMEEVEWGLLKVVFWVAGDEAYKISEWIITPFPSSTLTQDEDNFNFVLSSLRIHIEQAFGMLVARWRIIRNGLNFSVKRCSRIISTVMKLHNFCVLEDNFGKKGSSCAWDGLYESLNVHERDELRSDQGNVVREMTRVHRENLERSRRGVEEPITRTRGANCIPSHKREVLKSMVKTKGYVRPSAS